MLKYFGTDGIRGCIGVLPITPEFIVKLGWAVGSILPSSPLGKKVIIGKDTRLSGYLFESALQAGLSAAATDIYLTGPMPTPAIAYLTRTLHAQMGIVISASHNDNLDNGIKFFSAQGYKLAPDLEEKIERQLEKPLQIEDPRALGKAHRIIDAPGRYIEYCKSAIAHHCHLNHFKIIIDCANGATYHIAPKVFTELGAKVLEMNTCPDGLNINENCGSLHPASLSQRVIAEKADIGLAFDGDGDRLLLIDHRGEVVDGDEILCIIAKNLLKTRRFSGGVVGTVMSNSGLALALQRLGLGFVRSGVGDQQVIEVLQKNNWMLGGENSGHIIYREVNTTADGIVTALLVLEAMVNSGQTLHELKKSLEKLPQRFVNIPANHYPVSLSHPKLEKALLAAEKKLKKQGRILVRPSGTQAVIRLMVEGQDSKLVDEVVSELTEVITALV